MHPSPPTHRCSKHLIRVDTPGVTSADLPGWISPAAPADVSVREGRGVGLGLTLSGIMQTTSAS